MHIYDNFINEQGKLYLLYTLSNNSLDTLTKEQLIELFTRLAHDFIIIVDEEISIKDGAKILGKSPSWGHKASSCPTTELQKQFHRLRIKDSIEDEADASNGIRCGVTVPRMRIIQLRERNREGYHA